MSRRLNLEDEKELMALGKALSSEIRIRILELLQKEPLCVNEIAEILEIPPSSARAGASGSEPNSYRTKAGNSWFYEALYSSGNQHFTAFGKKGNEKKRRNYFYARRKLCGL